jgi:hypothetical protein
MGKEELAAPAAPTVDGGVDGALSAAESDDAYQPATGILHDRPGHILPGLAMGGIHRVWPALASESLRGRCGIG